MSEGIPAETAAFTARLIELLQPPSRPNLPSGAVDVECLRSGGYSQIGEIQDLE